MSRAPMKLCLVAIGVLASVACLAQIPRGRASAASSPEDSLKTFLRKYLRKRSDTEDKTTRVSVAFVQLQGSGTPEAIVYLTGQSWCGSGGCLTLVLGRKDSSYKVVSSIPITRLPIRVLRGTSKGWHDIGIWVQGGGIQPGYEAELQFNGRTYPTNPSMPPAKPLRRNVGGEVVISAEQEGTPLYP